MKFDFYNTNNIYCQFILDVALIHVIYKYHPKQFTFTNTAHINALRQRQKKLIKINKHSVLLCRCECVYAFGSSYVHKIKYVCDEHECCKIAAFNTTTQQTIAFECECVYVREREEDRERPYAFDFKLNQCIRVLLCTHSMLHDELCCVATLSARLPIFVSLRLSFLQLARENRKLNWPSETF